jgi:predicted dehydrogenase
MLRVAMADADEMVENCAQAGVKLMYAENWVYAPAIQKVRALVEASGGVILDLRGEESHHGSHASYAMEWRHTGGGALIRLGAHPIGGMLYLKRAEGLVRGAAPITVTSVTAQVATLTDLPAVVETTSPWIVRDWVDVENWAAAILTFSDGTKGTVFANDVCLGGMKDFLEVYLDNARIQCNFSRANLVEAYAPDPTIFEAEYLVEKLETKAGWSFPAVGEEWALGYHHELADFVDCVATGRDPRSDGELGREVTKVIYGAYLSAEQGRTIELA